MNVKRLLRLYPPAWRRRYAEEMLALLDEHHVTWRTRINLLLGALDAWIHPQLTEPQGLKGDKQMRRHLALGLLLGAGFGLWNLIVTRLDPLAEDTPIALLGFYGPMFAIWGLAGFGASWRSGRLLDGVKVGAAVAFVTFVVFDLAVFLRANLFLDVLTQRSDWQNLLVRYRASGFESLRAYVNYEGAIGAPFKIFAASMIGVVTGLVGGLLGSLSRRMMRQILPE